MLFIQLKKIISLLLGRVGLCRGLLRGACPCVQRWLFTGGSGAGAGPQCSLRWRYLPALSLAALAQALCLFCCKWFQYLISSLGWN